MQDYNGSDVLVAISEKRCDVGLIYLDVFKNIKQNSSFNKNCEIDRVGIDIDFMESRFALMDSIEFCS